MQNTKLLSFDIFDTLVTRCVSTPVEVFSCVERHARTLGIESAIGFRQRRIEAEECAIKAYGSERLTLDQIYSCMELPDWDKSYLRTIEVEAEVNLAVPIVNGVQLYKSAVKSGNPVVLISDMYLPASSIKLILEHCGIDGYDRLYVSSEYGESKASGNLFVRVLKDYAMSPSSLHHYGDSVRSDYLVPRRIGAKSTLLRNGIKYSKNKAELDRIRNKISPPRAFNPQRIASICCNNDFERAGFSSLGPFLFAFTHWLHDKKTELDLDGLIFLSRDGYLMRQAYEIVYPGEKTQYVFASRRAWTVPLFCNNLDLNTVLNQMGLGRKISFAELLSRLGFSKNQIEEITDKSSFSADEVLTVASLGMNRRFQSLYRDLLSQIASNSIREREACLAYISASIPKGSFGIVDIGWKGSMQHALESLLDEFGIESKIIGLYAGVDRSSKWINKQRMYGFLFDWDSDVALQDRESLYNALFEGMFVAPHGSLSHYELKEGKVIPIFERPETGIEDGASPLFEIQRGALKYLKTVVSNNWVTYLGSELPDALSSLERLGLRPTKEEAREIGDVEFAYQKYEPLAKPRTFRHYLMHPVDLINDFQRCYWKPAFLCRLTHMQLNYTNLLLTLKHVAYGRLK